MSKPWYSHFDYWVRPNLNYPRRPLTDILRIASSYVTGQTIAVDGGGTIV